MAVEYPYVLSNGRIAPFIDALGQAAKPPKLSYEFLKTLGFASSNDRAFVSLFRKLGFIGDNGVPTEAFDMLRDKQLRKGVLAQQMRELYADMFAANTEVQKASDEEVKGLMSRLTGKDADFVQRIFNTFKALAAQASFDAPPAATVKLTKEEPQESSHAPSSSRHGSRQGAREFHYNIQIHLPITTDITVYNAIFRAMREHLDA